jgi:hypothetical protein
VGGVQFPIAGFVLGVVIFIMVCLANWYSPFRKKINYWLTLQENEALAYAWAEPTLYVLNGLFIFVSVILIVLSVLIFNGEKTYRVLFKCEDGSSVTLNMQNPAQLEVTSGDGNISIFPKEETPEKITMYGNEAYAYTFVGGYVDQVIFTKRAGPFSTICHAAKALK